MLALLGHKIGIRTPLLYAIAAQSGPVGQRPAFSRPAHPRENIGALGAGAFVTQ